MIEFFSNYGLFLAKTLTVVVAVIIILITMASLAIKNKDQDGKLYVTDLNEQLLETEKSLKSAIFSKSELKKWQKNQKKKLKEREKSEEYQPKLFVIRFDGDMKASETTHLKECINAILETADSKDEVLLILESAGGFVHSYGLAASQLNRIREHNIRLTVAIDKCAASGGYLMACVATKIIAAPFAIIGSIGVVGQLPNFHKVLKKYDIEYEMHTAGDYKRTLTVFGENTDRQRKKFIEEIETTHVLFKDYITIHRPQVDINEVATGEHWHAIQAFEKKLVDKLETSDDYILASAKSKHIFEIEYKEKQKLSDRITSRIAAQVESRILKFLTQYRIFKY